MACWCWSAPFHCSLVLGGRQGEWVKVKVRSAAACILLRECQGKGFTQSNSTLQRLGKTYESGKQECHYR